MKLPKFSPILVGCLVAMAAGLPGVAERLFMGHEATQTPQPVPWGLWIAAYTFFSGISAGAFIVVALPHVFGYKRFRPLVPFALLVALVGLVGAMIFVLADLGRPERSLHIFMSLNTISVMGWVIVLYTVYGGLLAAMLWYALRPEWAKRALHGSRLSRILALGYKPSPRQEVRDARVLKVMGYVGLACALGLGGGVGALFSSLGTRSLWHSGLFPITFLVSAILSGTSMVLAGAALFGTGGKAFRDTLLILGKVIGYLLVVELIILPAETLIVVSGAIPSHLKVIAAIGAGPYPWVFWGLQVGLGTVAALLLLFLPKKATLLAAAVASLFVLVGVFAFRLNFVIPEMALGDFALSDGAPYVPNIVEWNLVAFGVGFAGLCILIGRKILPIFPDNAPLEFELASRETRRPWVNALQHQGQWR